MSDSTVHKDPYLMAHDFFSDVSKGDLQQMGLGDVAYIKRYIVKGHEAFVLHAADGAAISIQRSETVAKQNAYYQDLEVALLH